MQMRSHFMAKKTEIVIFKSKRKKCRRGKNKIK